MRIDSHWVIEGDSAQALLYEQGYGVDRRLKRHGIIWAWMTKEVRK